MSLISWIPEILELLIKLTTKKKQEDKGRSDSENVEDDVET